ncbi:MAG TPA: adenylate/guanylate cyclase domain-containing protein, partial [Anaerolineae bacterium]|nr:adenylate/guanylate cyclase domain-containing protein [Anaerolineae bacterium]
MDAQFAGPTTRTRTFLFTDIEGSTTRWETQRAAMTAALRRHDALLRSAIEEQGGQVCKTVGDAFCAAFATASDALAAALAAQCRIAGEDCSRPPLEADDGREAVPSPRPASTATRLARRRAR